MAHPLFSWTPEIVSFTYWPAKPAFDLEEDLYDNWYMFVIVDGSMWYRLEELDLTGQAGTGGLVLCPPGVRFKRRVLTPLSFHVIQFASGLEDRSTPGLSAGLLSLRDMERFMNTCRRLQDCTSLPWEDTKHWVRHYTRDLWTQWLWDTSVSLPAPDPLMQKAADYLEQHDSRSLNLDQVAQAINLSTAQLNRRFRRSFGQTPHEYLTARRLHKACLLLRTSALTLEQISEACGYSNGQYLSRLFHKQMQMTPNEYRKKYRI